MKQANFISLNNNKINKNKKTVCWNTEWISCPYDVDM